MSVYIRSFPLLLLTADEHARPSLFAMSQHWVGHPLGGRGIAKEKQKQVLVHHAIDSWIRWCCMMIERHKCPTTTICKAVKLRSALALTLVRNCIFLIISHWRLLMTSMTSIDACQSIIIVVVCDIICGDNQTTDSRTQCVLRMLLSIVRRILHFWIWKGELHSNDYVGRCHCGGPIAFLSHASSIWREPPTTAAEPHHTFDMCGSECIRRCAPKWKQTKK